MRVALILLACLPVLSAADLEISRPVRTWEFLDAVGPKSGILGREDGTLEGYVYPLKIFKDLRLRFHVDGRVIPGESVARRIVSRPGSYLIVYSGDEFEVRETLAASVDQPGAVIRLQISAYVPTRVDVEFARDFQLMWPASMGTAYGEWNVKEQAWLFGADGQPYAAVLGSPDASITGREYGSNYSSDTANSFTLGTVTGTAERTLVFAGSVKSRPDALAVYRKLLADPLVQIAAAEKHDRDYLARTVALDLPDPQLQAAYDWSKLSQRKGLVENPFLGPGLVAGYGPSKGVYRPGFAWFFGRDTFWTSFALTSAGDLEAARAAIDFISKFQRADGKIPHEISQSASLVRWFEQFPYGYASADATPLYVAAVSNYTQASGDAAYARGHWGRLLKAFEFMRAHFEANGFPKNFEVGHGWIEGGPLLPVGVEFYQAGCYVEALRSMALIARAIGENAMAVAFDREFQVKKKALNDLFWLPKASRFAFALDQAGQPVDQPTVLTTVPMWFGLLDPAKSTAMIEGLSGEEHASDWGMRIISSHNPVFSPEGYHFGSVWPLFTGWASVGEYRYHAAAAAYANLRANAWLALDGAGGNATEVLSGMTYSPLSTASPHQIWSAAMVVSPLLRGLCGLDVDASRKHVTFAPHLPADWNRLGVRNVPVGTAMLDLAIERDASSLRLRVVNHGSENLEIDFAPAYPPSARVTTTGWTAERTASDWHPHFAIAAKPGESTLAIAHQGWFGYSVPYEAPQLGGYSGNLKVLSEHWSGAGKLELTLSGRGSREYRLPLAGASLVSSVEGGKLQGGELLIGFPKGSEYTTQAVTIHLRQP